MGLALNSAEQIVLMVLSDSYQGKVHLHPLAERIALPLEPNVLLKTLDGLLSRKFIECRPLRGAEGLADAANILFSPGSAAELSRSAFPREAPVQVMVVKGLIASPSDVHRNAQCGFGIIPARDHSEGNVEWAAQKPKTRRKDGHKWAVLGRPRWYFPTNAGQCKSRAWNVSDD